MLRFMKRIVIILHLFITAIICLDINEELKLSNKPTCLNVIPVQNFNFAAYTEGYWYEIGRANNAWESSGDCVGLTHDVKDNVTTFKISTISNRKAHIVTGTVTDEDANGTGVIKYISSAYNDSEGIDNIPVKIIAIDYNVYAVVYHCYYKEKTNKLHKYIWILGRKSKLDDEINKIVTSIVPTVFDISLMKWNQFTNEFCEIQTEIIQQLDDSVVNQ